MEDLIKLRFENNLSEKINLEELKEIIDSFSMDLEKSMKERRSGFHKAMRIIKSDLMCAKNDMKLFLDDDNRFCVEIEIYKETLAA